VGGQRAFEQAVVQRRADLLQQTFAVERLDLEAGDADRVEFPAVGLFLGRQTLQDFDGRGAPQVDLDAVALLEVGDQRLDGRRGVRGVDVDRAFLARRLDQVGRRLRRREWCGGEQERRQG